MMSNVKRKHGLPFLRFLMVISGMTPLFLLWGIRGTKAIPDVYLWSICGVLIIFPNVFLLIRIWITSYRDDTRKIFVQSASDRSEHLLVYLFATLLPLYDANLGDNRDILAVCFAFIFIIFLFWHMNLHYMNLVFALFGYRVFTVEAVTDLSKSDEPEKYHQTFVVLSKRHVIRPNETLDGYRLSDTVIMEKGV